MGEGIAMTEHTEQARFRAYTSSLQVEEFNCTQMLQCVGRAMAARSIRRRAAVLRHKQITPAHVLLELRYATGGNNGAD